MSHGEECFVLELRSFYGNRSICEILQIKLFLLTLVKYRYIGIDSVGTLVKYFVVVYYSLLHECTSFISILF